MKFREIKQHHIPAIISIMVLFIMDSLAFYCAYLVTENMGIEFVGIKYPFRVFIFIIFLIYISKCYNPSPIVSRSYESKTIIQLIYLIGIVYICYRISSKSISIDKAQYDLVFLHSFIFIDILFRLLIRSTQRYFLTKGYGGRATIIVGSSEDAFNLADEMNRNLSLGFVLRGYFNESENIHMSRYCNYLGTPVEIKTYLDNHNINEMIIVLDSHEHEKLLQIIGKFNLYDICIKIIPDMYEAITGQVRIETIRGLPLLNINPDIITEYQLFLKRSGDVFLAITALILFCPFYLLIALLVRMSSSGTILYKQVRVGLHGEPFVLIKFRTMFDDSERTTGPIWAEEDDPRVTPIGKILRKYHFDEVPQLLNVLWGDMSIIGPRPERPKIIEELLRDIPYYSHRLKVKPGITGWAQIMGAYDRNIGDVHNKLKHDFYYIENMSILLDLKIIFMTLWVVLRGEGN
jgi:exopolysaccharide biosynthesis polyprenyl glycosylphosphotransferase